MASRHRRNKPIFHVPSVAVDDRLLSWLAGLLGPATRSSAMAAAVRCLFTASFICSNRQLAQWRRQELKFGGGAVAPLHPFPPLPPFPSPSHALSRPSHFPFPLPSSIPFLSLPYPRLPLPSHPLPFPIPFPSPSLPRSGPLKSS